MWVLFFTHMVNCIFNAMPTERLQQHLLFARNCTTRMFFL